MASSGLVSPPVQNLSQSWSTCDAEFGVSEHRLSIGFLFDILHALKTFEVCVLGPQRGLISLAHRQDDAVCHCQF